MATATQTLERPRTRLKTLSLELAGESPLIVHRFGEPARKQIRDKQQAKGSASQKKEPKDPDAAFRESLYVIEGDRYGDLSECRFGVKAIGLKQAIVSAARTSEFSMTELRQAVHVPPTVEDLIEVLTPEPPKMREDRVVVGRAVLDLRYRPSFWPWSLRARFHFHSATLSAEQLLVLIEEAGFTVGIGDWRPEKGGIFGRFGIADSSVTLEDGVH